MSVFVAEFDWKTIDSINYFFLSNLATKLIFTKIISVTVYDD